MDLTPPGHFPADWCVVVQDNCIEKGSVLLWYNILLQFRILILLRTYCSWCMSSWSFVESITLHFLHLIYKESDVVRRDRTRHDMVVACFIQLSILCAGPAYSVLFNSFYPTYMVCSGMHAAQSARIWWWINLFLSISVRHYLAHMPDISVIESSIQV